jgi:hypothetical protein
VLVWLLVACTAALPCVRVVGRLWVCAIQGKAIQLAAAAAVGVGVGVGVADAVQSVGVGTQGGSMGSMCMGGLCCCSSRLMESV